MPDIEVDTGLAGYLAKDAAVIEESLKEWGPEYTALIRLVDIFRRLTQLVVIKDQELNIPSQLFLVVLNQSYGIASELLRRRTRDAQALARRAVEAAGIAYRLWKRPELIQVYNEAYPHMTEDSHPRQFQPSDQYRKEFRSSELFPDNIPAFQTLRSLYELFSVGATHAGLGALAEQKWKDGVLSLSVRQTDRVEIGRAWHSINTAYWTMLRVFFAILKSSIPNGWAVAVEADMKQWLENYKATLKDRTPWISDIVKEGLEPVS